MILMIPSVTSSTGEVLSAYSVLQDDSTGCTKQHLVLWAEDTGGIKQDPVFWDCDTGGTGAILSTDILYILGRILGMCCIDSKFEDTCAHIICCRTLGINEYTLIFGYNSLQPPRGWRNHQRFGSAAATVPPPIELEPLADPVLLLIALVGYHRPNSQYSTQ